MLKGDRKICSDTESTGLEKDDRVIEIGGVEIIGNVITGNVYHQYINPGRRQVHPEALKVHGLTNEFLKDYPEFHQVVADWEKFIGNSPVIFHNARFDIGMFREEYARLKRPMFPNVIEDSLVQALKKYPSQPNSLDALCRRFKIDNTNRALHGALLDSNLLAQVYIEMHGLNQLDLTVVQDTGSSTSNQAEAADSFQQPAEVLTGLVVSPRAEEMARHNEFLSKFIAKNIWKDFLPQNG